MSYTSKFTCPDHQIECLDHCPLCVMESDQRKIAEVKASPVLRWVNAADRLPEFGKEFNLKVDTGKEIILDSGALQERSNGEHKFVGRYWIYSSSTVGRAVYWLEEINLPSNQGQELTSIHPTKEGAETVFSILKNAACLAQIASARQLILDIKRGNIYQDPADECDKWLANNQEIK